MSEFWEDDTKAKELSIPGIALPGLRDLKVQFVALIPFDEFLGPIVYLKEILGGSSYINKLKDIQTLSEVYAGVARSDVDTLSTSEDVIAVFRYDPNQNSDITTVFLISCKPDSDLDDIRKIGSKALIRSKGDPHQIGKNLSLGLRELHSGVEDYQRTLSDENLKLLVEDQIKKPLDYNLIKGVGVIDLEVNLVDFRLMPSWYNGKELNPYKLLQFLDRQYESIESDSTTTLLFKSIPFIIIKVKSKEIYFAIIIGETDLNKIIKLGDWLNKINELLNSEWRFASKSEIIASLGIIDKLDNWNSHFYLFENYIRMCIRSDRITPRLLNEKLLEMTPPKYITLEQWKAINSFNGNITILEMEKRTNFGILNIIRLLEWFHIRNLIAYLE